MRFLPSLFFLLAILFVRPPKEVKADFLILIGDGSPLSFTAGNSAQIGVWAYPSISGTVLDSYRVAFDLDAAGVGYSGTFGSFVADFSTGVIGSNPSTDSTFFAQNDPLADNYDFLLGGSTTSSVNLNAINAGNPVKLFDLKFSIASSATPGTYSFIFRDDATRSGSPINAVAGSGLNGASLVADPNSAVSFEVTAVPEPTSMLLVVAGFAGLTGARRLKKRRVPAAQQPAATVS